MLRETMISHLVKPEDLQHHGTLFAGQMAKWFVEACFVAATRLHGRPKDIVCVQVHNLHFAKPANNGDIIEIRSNVAFTGSTSITVHGEVFINEDETPAISGFVTYVTVDSDGKPYKHGLSLPAEYIERNRKIYNEAKKIRGIKVDADT